MQTVAELPEFIPIADKRLNLEERQDLVRYLASHPKAGDLMEGTGGVRKLRWRRGDHGKSAGVRVIYYFHDDRMPLYLLALFAKGDRAKLSKAERNELAELTGALVNIWKSKGKKTWPRHLTVSSKDSRKPLHTPKGAVRACGFTALAPWM